MENNPKPAADPRPVEPAPRWLEKLQNERWEAEILISGGAFIGLFASLSAIDTLRAMFFYTTDIDWSLVANLVTIVRYGWWMLMSGFLIHLILRGFWVGLIGLNAVFPAGINAKKLALKGKFSRIGTVSSNVPMILLLDKICGTVFALTFIALFSIAGFFIVFGLIMSVTNATEPLANEWIKQLIVVVTAGIGALILIDFLTFGMLKQESSFARFYYPIHFVVSILTLSILYRRLYYTLASNMRRRYLGLIVLFQFLLAVLLTVMKGNSSAINSSLLEYSLLGGPGRSYVTLSEEVVRGNSVAVSILHSVRFEQPMFEDWKKTAKEVGSKSRFYNLSSQDQRMLLEKTYQVQVDSTIIDAPHWTYESTRLFDLFFSPAVVEMSCRVDISSLSQGNHELKIRLGLEDEELLEFTGQKSYGHMGKAYFYVER